MERPGVSSERLKISPLSRRFSVERFPIFNLAVYNFDKARRNFDPASRKTQKADQNVKDLYTRHSRELSPVDRSRAATEISVDSGMEFRQNTNMR